MQGGLVRLRVGLNRCATVRAPHGRRPLLDFVEGRLIARGTIDPEDAARITVTDSPEEAVAVITAAGLGRFGLTYRLPVQPRRILGELPRLVGGRSRGRARPDVAGPDGARDL